MIVIADRGFFAHNLQKKTTDRAFYYRLKTYIIGCLKILPAVNENPLGHHWVAVERGPSVARVDRRGVPLARSTSHSVGLVERGVCERNTPPLG